MVLPDFNVIVDKIINQNSRKGYIFILIMQAVDYLSESWKH